ncbi:MAG: hypothetical protein PGN11_14355 [Quadrisphaera sp.]
MDEGGGWVRKHVETASNTHAGPAVRHGPQAEPDHPPLRGPAVAALEALARLAAADGAVVALELPATRERGWPVEHPLPSAWWRTPDTVETGLFAFDPANGWERETDAEEALRVADTAHEAVLESMPSCGRPTNWPPCPDHPTTHPLQLVAGDDADPRPRWTCPLTGDVVGVLGDG